MSTGIEKLAPGRHHKITLTFTPEVTGESLNAALQHVFKLTGCRTCGIRGIDLTLRGGDPELLGQFAGVGALSSVHVE